MSATVRSPWRWFPHALIAALGAVILVNLLLVYLALHSFPGAAGTDDFKLNQIYDRVLQSASEQQARGWRVELALDPDQHVLLRLADRNGYPLSDPTIHIVATRPVGPEDTQHLDFAASGRGVLLATERLPPGQWSLSIDIASGSDRLTGTKRLVAR